MILKMVSKRDMDSINRIDSELIHRYALLWGRRSTQSKEPFEGFQANQPFKGSKPLKGLILTFFIFTQFAFAATINIPADYSTIRKGGDK